MCSSWVLRERMRERGGGIYMGLPKRSRWSSGYPAPALPVALPEVPIGLGLRSDMRVHSRHFWYSNRNFRLDLLSALPMNLPEVPTEDSPRTQRTKSPVRLQSALPMEVPELPVQVPALPIFRSELPSGGVWVHPRQSALNRNLWTSGDLWSELPMA